MGSRTWETALGGMGYGYRDDIAENKYSRIALGAASQESTLDEGSNATRIGLGGIASRANGGPISSGRPYLVGERGPEIIVPNHNGYVFPRQSKKRRTDAFLPTAPDNYTPASQMPAMPDFGGGQPTTQANPQQTTGMLANGNADPNATQKPGLYDYWKTPVMGNMPLDQFVQLTGMMANAFDPNGQSGRLGGNMAAMAHQANRDRMGYEEREQERAVLNQRYEQQRKDQRFSKFVDFASRSKNPTLAKTAYDQMKGEWEADFGKPLPDWDPEATPDVMKQLKEFHEAAKEMGLDAESIKKGDAEILYRAGEISGKDYMDINYPKEAKEAETWSEPYEAKVGGKKAIVQKSSRGKVAPVIQDKSTTVTVTPDGGRTKKNTVVYVDKVNGARHVVDLHNPKHVKWLEKYGPQLQLEKDYEKDKAAVDPFGQTTEDPVGIR